MNEMSQPMQVLTSKKTHEWYTPEEWIERVKRVFGGHIGLDPASNLFAQRWIDANLWYGPDQIAENFPEFADGLEATWNHPDATFNNVFCNPPYNGSSAAWVKKAESEYLLAQKHYGHYDNVFEEILLVNNAAGYNWFEDLMDKWTTCSVRERIRFVDESGNVGGQAKKASVFAYLGKDNSKFISVFKSLDE